MTSAPFEGPAGEPDTGGDLGVGGPAEETDDRGGAGNPPEYPEETDPFEGPAAALGRS